MSIFRSLVQLSNSFSDGPSTSRSRRSEGGEDSHPWSRRNWPKNVLLERWPYLTLQQVEGFKSVFDMLDSDGKGYFSKEELYTVMKAMGGDPTPQELEAVLNELDCSGDGNVDFGEFLTRYKDALDEDALVGVFNQLAIRRKPNGTGEQDDDDKILTLEALKNCFAYVGDPISEPDQKYLKLMFDTADVDKDGSLTISEFFSYLYELGDEEAEPVSCEQNATSTQPSVEAEEWVDDEDPEHGHTISGFLAKLGKGKTSERFWRTRSSLNDQAGGGGGQDTPQSSSNHAPRSQDLSTHAQGQVKQQQQQATASTGVLSNGTMQNTMENGLYAGIKTTTQSAPAIELKTYRSVEVVEHRAPRVEGSRKERSPPLTSDTSEAFSEGVQSATTSMDVSVVGSASSRTSSGVNDSSAGVSANPLWAGGTGTRAVNPALEAPSTLHRFGSAGRRSGGRSIGLAGSTIVEEATDTESASQHPSQQHLTSGPMHRAGSSDLGEIIPRLIAEPSHAHGGSPPQSQVHSGASSNGQRHDDADVSFGTFKSRHKGQSTNPAMATSHASSRSHHQSSPAPSSAELELVQS
mmetsp:Transcript_35629/g.79236  ORF Transcript_35629/g.79236 Transcript_35629/m.79236 type:complete len:578 (-) Transcript_35629:613-2346(-)|eukprot:CAMPEP_0202904190 /NCGR_PEP_ID=MMETSP1392-20130828/28270_1 /ASSEMBLY_ACC=CAM_ASM_000868 /TAXON_ID=225041 /ORGANISM="Chlamydomonas chlamydogama, Strain SAG 11-48b" /LENGTH=577 /DNA_ID=CAMNT_0049591709 /DNA_START=50 /DNA_END=1783 /DNA_ORIENTATION=-